MLLLSWWSQQSPLCSSVYDFSDHRPPGTHWRSHRYDRLSPPFSFLAKQQDQTETIVVIRRKQLYVYPVKGLRGCELQEARVGQHGFVGDRTFSLQKVHRDENDPSEKTYETLLIGRCLQLALFETSVHNVSNEVAVKWHDRETEFDKRAADAKVDTDDEIRFPLSPGLEGLEECEVSLHVSRTKAYDMGDGPASWFSDRLGFETRLVYIGDGSRAVLGSLAPNSRGGLKKAKWTSRLRALVPSLAFREERLVFNDLGHYLVVTEASNSQVSSRLEGGAEMDVRKFRPTSSSRARPRRSRRTSGASSHSRAASGCH
ncbi:MOSC domain-containing protein [Colletotrichum higginsianum]|uniref:MOSC domain-containing protein n=1 Tax=Colletotrichum higginsianum (strain IMI 349063) TaxID=759273 RepID=H1VF97_COLHI|nr:MOSC domain-containing protein [Colletotrichum higginsianum]